MRYTLVVSDLSTTCLLLLYALATPWLPALWPCLCASSSRYLCSLPFFLKPFDFVSCLHHARHHRGVALDPMCSMSSSGCGTRLGVLGSPMGTFGKTTGTSFSFVLNSAVVIYTPHRWSVLQGGSTRRGTGRRYKAGQYHGLWLASHRPHAQHTRLHRITTALAPLCTVRQVRYGRYGTVRYGTVR